MKRMTRAGSGEAGYALIVVMILVFSMGIVGAAFFSMAGRETVASHVNLNSQRAFWLAEGGKARAMRYLSELSNPPTAGFFIYQDVAGPDGGTYTVHCAVDTTAVWAVEKAFMLECVGNSGGIERRVRQRVRMTSFAQYAMFTDNESNGGTQIWHITGDVIGGRLHTNGTLCISGNPRFLGRVSSASDHMMGYQNHWVDDMNDWPVGGNNPYFAEGAELNAPQIAMPTTTTDLRHDSLFGGVYNAPETDLELGVTGATVGVPTPGWLRYRNHTPPNGTWTSVQISSLANSIFFCNNDLHVSGVLDGELTVASHRNIRIVDDIKYQASDAQGTPLSGCNDLLGLVAERDIIIADNAANRNNLIVDAVLMALDTSIEVENYDSGSPRGTLTIWGGLIQKYRGAVGQFRGNTIIHGYQKNYHYDPRVTGRVPPSFPLTGVYEETGWEETWDESYPF
jgi:Tfp pilus assembly protein PilX